MTQSRFLHVTTWGGGRRVVYDAVRLTWSSWSESPMAKDHARPLSLPPPRIRSLMER